MEKTEDNTWFDQNKVKLGFSRDPKQFYTTLDRKVVPVSRSAFIPLHPPNSIERLSIGALKIMHFHYNRAIVLCNLKSLFDCRQKQAIEFDN